jgi:hypothetical protein
MPASKNYRKPLSQVRAAKILGVTREHLNRVLRGHRSSHSLLSRHQKLLKEAA